MEETEYVGQNVCYEVLTSIIYRFKKEEMKRFLEASRENSGSRKV